MKFDVHIYFRPITQIEIDFRADCIAATGRCNRCDATAKSGLYAPLVRHQIVRKVDIGKTQTITNILDVEHSGIKAIDDKTMWHKQVKSG
jgi:hypothetical protein